MKVKEVNRTANIAWSPAPQYPIYLAAGTAAQQLDATFRYDYEMPLWYCMVNAERKHSFDLLTSLLKLPYSHYIYMQMLVPGKVYDW